MAEQKCSKFNEPKNLKDALEFIDKLSSSGVSSEVIDNIKSKVEGYLGSGNGYLFFGGSQSSFGMLLGLLSELRKKFLKDKSYETYKDCTSEEDKKCIATYEECLLNNIYDIFGSIYYLYFMCYSDSRTYGGGDWNNDYGTEESGNLKTWLTSNEKTVNHTLKLTGGFNAEKLNEKLSQDGTSDINNTLFMLIIFTGGGLLQFPLEHMLFLGKWSNAKTANALSFLVVFCGKVSNDSSNYFGDHLLSNLTLSSDNQAYNGITYDSIKSTCPSLPDSIKKVTEQIGAGTIGSSTMYSYLLDKEKFINYLEWLDNNLTDLINSLNLMQSDVQNWTKDDLNASKSYGPFAFGFCFIKDNWDDDNQLKSNLKNKLTDIISQLENLQSNNTSKETKVTEACSPENVSEEASSDRSEVETSKILQEISKNNSNPSGNTIATASGVVGGVIGLGTLVTYGAASGHLGKTALGVFTALSSVFH